VSWSWRYFHGPCCGDLALCFRLLFYLAVPCHGGLVGELSGHGILLDCAYLSFVTFTTLGYGEIVAQGYLRYLTGVEALTGFILITWSASFLFIEMQKYWTTYKSNQY